MCGIAGYLSPFKKVENEYLNNMVQAIRHRGPDALNVWQNESSTIGLTHARLSILDLSEAGAQPMHSIFNRFVIVFNGEIYNHNDIRFELATIGRQPSWRGHSDTETLLAGFEVWGIKETIKRCVGMFAMAIWDAKEEKLILVRDRMGEKPLYYGVQSGILYFGSELKSLLAHPLFNVEINRDALSVYLNMSYVPAPMSIYKNVYKLLPGTILEITKNDLNESTLIPYPYWSFNDERKKAQELNYKWNDESAVLELERLMIESVKIQQISDVSIGAFLSGGVDSSAIVSIMQNLSSLPINTFTIGFNEKQYDESMYASDIAKFLKTNHTCIYVTPRETMDVITQLPIIYDEPFADSSQIPTYLVSKIAREKVTVSLSGDAGDELFCGYNRYLWGEKISKIPKSIRKVANSSLDLITLESWDKINAALTPLLPKKYRLTQIADKIQKLSSLFNSDSQRDIYFNLLSVLKPNEVLVYGSNLNIYTNQAENLFSDITQFQEWMMAMDTLTYLPDDILQKVDRAAMSVSLETRAPFLDHRIVSFAWSLPMHMKIRNGVTKWVLREVLNKYVPKRLIERPKMGFGVPIDQWLRGPLKDWASDLLDSSRLENEGYLNSNLVSRKWEMHQSGKYNCQQFLWNVLMFQAWLAEHKKYN
jgi:asparagine synthase (glutamine-hydrolysing)